MESYYEEWLLKKCLYDFSCGIRDFNTLFCIDDHECLLRTALCDQNCRNTPGSYTCSCNTGYSLNRNGFICDGIKAIMITIRVHWF